MGVTGLWTVVQPCARPIKIETLNKKRLAVDASIWIYQFLKAVRDKEGNALRNSHVVGFFRRICKLLFVGIKPVFVFDGAAPALKRQTISARNARREGRREDAARTAGKLLAVQMQRRAEEEERKRKDGEAGGVVGGEEPLPENLVYVDELQLSEKERQQQRKFKKTDAYHLPDLDVDLAGMGAPNDPRVMNLEELEVYARQFDTGEDINVYDFSKIDFDSPFFTSLPASDRYNILNAARLRSRLRMGYSKDQLDTMFPDRMAFSRFQIERVTERNELTQRLMHINGMVEDGGWNGPGRVAGEKGIEYVLVKNDGVEGGWALGVVSNKEEGERSRPIDVDDIDKEEEEEEEEEEYEEDEEEFEDVPIPGLNRLEKRKEPLSDLLAENLARQRRTLYDPKKNLRSVRASPSTAADDQDDSLFVAEDKDDEEWEDVEVDGDRATRPRDDEVDEEEAELQRAIAMSLEKDKSPIPPPATNDSGSEEVFIQKRADDSMPFFGGSGRSIASMANNRSSKATVSRPVEYSDDDSDGDNDLQAALARKRKTMTEPRKQSTIAAKPSVAKSGPFDGPLPFERLNLGNSILGKKKTEKAEEVIPGGFLKDLDKAGKKKDAPLLPPWFSGDVRDDMTRQEELEDKARRNTKAERGRIEMKEKEAFVFDNSMLARNDQKEIIDLDAEPPCETEVIALDDEDKLQVDEPPMPSNVIVEDAELRMGGLADKTRAEPPVKGPPAQQAAVFITAPTANKTTAVALPDPNGHSLREASPNEIEDQTLDWSDSDHEVEQPKAPIEPAGGKFRSTLSPSPSPELEFEDVPMAEGSTASMHATSAAANLIEDDDGPLPASGVADDYAPIDVDEEDVEVPYDDPDDDELFRQLIQEEEEHARFASSLNNRSNSASIDYEKELRQLRNQQKKDRRDADEVTQTMILECQQLLTLFGLPYITAPMEAEAQCAELVRLGLVDGIVTDDSDIFLFGGTRVYKNMFNQAKFVECYLEQDLQSEFALTRARLIGIAQLLGSDYTEGLPGVGPVTALEIMSEFDDLSAFKDWWTDVQNGTRAKTADAGIPFRKKFRKNATKLFLPLSFPDPRVEEAYLKPEVDSDPQPFMWGVPDLNALRSFLMSTIGWTQERTDEILVPVVRDMNRRADEGTQANLTNFFDGGVGAGAFAPRRREEKKSKRLETALLRIKERSRGKSTASTTPANEDDAAAGTDAPATETAARKSRGKKRSKPAAEAPEMAPSDDDGDDYVEPKRKKASRKRAKA